MTFAKQFASYFDNRLTCQPATCNDSNDSNGISLHQVVGMVKSLQQKYDEAITSQRDLRVINRKLRNQLDDFRRTFNNSQSGAASSSSNDMNHSNDEKSEFGHMEKPQGQLDVSGKVFKVGWMFKEGSTIRNWKRRFFVLYGDRIEYFKGPHADKPKGSIELQTCTISPVQKRHKVLLFIVSLLIPFVRPLFCL